MSVSTRQPPVAIIILNWNGLQNTLDCLSSLRNLTYTNFKIVIVDNASTDGSPKVILKNFPQHHLICNSQNLGFPEGNNVGIRWALKEDLNYILLLNHDTTVDPNFLTYLVIVSESDSRVGIVGSRIVYHSQPQKSWSIGGYINRKSGRPLHIKPLNQPIEVQDKKITEVDWVSGCCLLIKTKVIREVGLLDADFFVGTEDVDWCIRAKKAGYKIFCVHNSVVYHKKPTKPFQKKYSSIQQYYTLRNLLIFIEKHSTFNFSFFISFFNVLVKRFTWSLINFDLKSMKAMWYAIGDFRRKRYGKAKFTL